MRKLLPVLLLAALLPGCVLAIGNSPDDNKSRSRINQLENRIAELEAQLEECKGCDACEEDDVFEVREVIVEQTHH